MFTDSTGYAWWNPFSWGQETKLKVMSGCLSLAGAILMFVPGAQVLGASLLGAGIGSFIGGHIAEMSGQDYIAGWIGGLVTGAVMGAASPLAGQLYGVAFSTTLGAGSAYVNAIMFTLTVGAFAGLTGSFTKQWVKGSFDPNELITDTLYSSALFTMFGPLMFVSYGVGTAGYLGLGAGIGILTEIAFDLSIYVIGSNGKGSEYFGFS